MLDARRVRRSRAGHRALFRIPLILMVLLNAHVVSARVVAIVPGIPHWISGHRARLGRERAELAWAATASALCRRAFVASAYSIFSPAGFVFKKISSTMTQLNDRD
jgi:hypothetical protein